MNNKTLIMISILFLLFLPIAKSNNYIIKDNGEIDVVISRDNVNRLKVFRDRISNIRSNSEELKIDFDKKSGELFLKPTGVKDVIDVFIKTESEQNYKITFKVKDVKAQQIFLNNSEFTLNNYSNSDALRKEKQSLIDENLYFDFEDDFKLSSINLIRVMSNRARINGWNIIERNQNLMNIKDFRIEWLYSYIHKNNSRISGEIAILTNKTNKSLNVKEEYFFRLGIRAVRVEKLILQPNESCYLYLVGGGVEK